MRMHRLIAILLLVESRGHIKARELAEALETSVRTIYRDVDTLCEAGIPLAASTGPNGGIYFVESYTVNMNKLHGDEAVNLYLSGIGIHPEAQSETGVKLMNALLKLEKSLPAEYKGDIKKARDRFYFDDTPWWGERPIIPSMDIIRQSVWQSRKLKIKYRKINGDISIRTIHPYGLIVKIMEWYLAAFCEASGEIRTFKCERIIEGQILEERFQIPEGFSLEAYWRESAFEFTTDRREAEKYPVLIKLHKSSSEILKKLEIHELKYEEEYILAEVNMHKYEYACFEVMDIVGHAEILQPVELRTFVNKELEKLLRKY